MRILKEQMFTFILEHDKSFTFFIFKKFFNALRVTRRIKYNTYKKCE